MSKVRWTEYDVEVDVDLDIKIEDLYNNLDERNIAELIDLLSKDGRLKYFDTKFSSIAHEGYINALNTLADAYYRISKEDEEVVMRISKKY